MSNWKGAASIGIIGGADSPTVLYISNKEKWKRLVRRGLLITAACLAVWRLARRVYKRK